MRVVLGSESDDGVVDDGGQFVRFRRRPRVESDGFQTPFGLFICSAILSAAGEAAIRL